jgi:plastocyanin
MPSSAFVSRKKGLGFDPSSINPGVGDTIVFEFRSGKHSVVRE